MHVWLRRIQSKISEVIKPTSMCMCIMDASLNLIVYGILTITVKI